MTVMILPLPEYIQILHFNTMLKAFQTFKYFVGLSWYLLLDVKLRHLLIIKAILLVWLPSSFPLRSLLGFGLISALVFVTSPENSQHIGYFHTFSYSLWINKERGQ